jgi:LacI family transcriptional regulator
MLAQSVVVPEIYRRMRRRRRRKVLLALTSATHHGFYRGATRYAMEHSWHLVADTVYASTIPMGWKGDGILSFVGYWEELACYVKSAGIPAVEISSVRRDLGLPYVGEDNEAIGRMAAEHLLGRNLKNFAWAPFWDDQVNEERCLGFARSVQAAGYSCVRLVPVNVNVRKSAFGSRHLNWSSRRSWLIRTIRSLRRPVGIFCYNDYVATDIVDVCIEAGLNIPEQVAVIGVDNDPVLCDCTHVPLSSVRHDLEGMAYEAAALLDRLMDGKAPPVTPKRIAPKGVVTRKSTDMLAVEHPEVAKALRFIQANFSRTNLSVCTIVEAGKLPRRSLEMAFRNELNRSILSEILRIRMKQARNLLQTTELPMADIAIRSGFANLNHFFRVFRTQIEMTPRAFRVASQSRDISR